MTSKDSSLATKPTSDVANTSASPFSGTSSMLDGKSTSSSGGSSAGAAKPGMFDAEGSVGKQFTSEGAIGGAAQAVGGPFDKEGAIGKQFTTEGSIGGSVQNSLGGSK